MIHNRVLFPASVSLLISASAKAATWYVDGSVSSSGDGTSWDEAVKKIQIGIYLASDGDTVIVAKGTYYEDVNFKGKNIVLRGEQGFGGNPIIDGHNDGPAVGFYGTEDASCVLTGFTIRHGKTDTDGGGIFGNGTHATIQSNLII